MRGGWRACAGRCARRELARLHLQPTHSCPALDSLLHSAASLTASTGTIGNNVAAAFSTASGSSFDVFMLFERLLRLSSGCSPVAAKRPGAAGRCFKASVTAQQRQLLTRATQAARCGVFGIVCGVFGMATRALRDAVAAEKKCCA